MPQVQPLGSQVSVRAEIQRASASTGVDFDYMLGQAGLESSLNPKARASTSSASGLYQFINSTWLNTVQKHGAKHGLDWAAASIEQTGKGPVIRDPAMRQQIMAMRFDPQVASLMAGEFAADNRATLQAALGREPNGTDLYLAHFLGPAGASSFLQNCGRDPNQSAAALFPKAASSNHNIFFDGAGKPRSLAEVYSLLETKLEKSIERHGGATDTDMGLGAGFQSFEIAAIDPATGMPSSFGAPPNFAPPEPQQLASASAPSATPRASMAETLRTSFGLDSGRDDAATSNVRKAYGILQAFNL
jgi:hypothetical protein